MSERKTVLVVDDVAENIRVLLELLRDEYQVIAAKSGEKALEMAVRSPQPDIILLDVMMPVMDGYEVCRRLKANNETCDIPVIFITALNEDVSEEKGFSVGAVDYITKPVSPPIVRARIATQLSLVSSSRLLTEQNRRLIEAAKLREDVERITKHDLKGPLTTIISMPSLLLRKENITDEQKEVLNLIKESGYLMLSMINNSLDLYKMEVGRYNYSPQDVDLVQVINKVLIESQNLSAAHRLGLKVCLEDKELTDDETFIVQAEPLLCHTMLSNLIKNAIESAPEGSQVKVNLFSRDNTPMITINNLGEVPQEIRDTFFDKYVTSGKEDGTGLGTYSAYMTARTQGGDITLDTSVAGETTITVSLSKINI